MGEITIRQPHARLFPLDRQQHLFPVLQRADHARLGDSHGCGELRDFAARLRSNQEPHVRVLCILGAYLYFRG